MPDVLNTVRTVYRAETSEAKAAVQSLRGVERERAKAILDDLNAQNAKLDAQIATIGRVTMAAGAMTGAYLLAKKAYGEYVEDVRLEAAATGADIDRLRDATRGLVEADDLLAFAGKAMHGVWKLNQEEMEAVLHGAVALRKTMGVELQPTIEKLTEAVGKGSTRALKEFGIEAKDKTEAIAKLSQAYTDLGGNVTLTGDDIAASGVKIADAMDDAAGKMGQAVSKLAPLVEGVAALVGALGDFIVLIDRLPDWLVPDSSDGGRLTPEQQILQQGAELRGRSNRIKTQATAGSFLIQKQVEDDYYNGMQSLFASDSQGPIAKMMWSAAKQLEMDADHLTVPILVKSANDALTTVNNAIAKAQAEAAAKAAESVKARGRGGRRGRAAAGDDVVGGDLSMFMGPLEDAAGGVANVGRAAFGAYQAGAADAKWAETLRETTALLDAQGRAADNTAAALAKINAEKELMATLGDAGKIFGVPTEIDAHTEAVNAMSTAYGVLGDAAGDAYEALVTGSGSATAAMKKALANGLLAMGRDFFVRALGETAMGLAALAIPGLQWNAGQHFAAAGAFGAAALAAGVGAAALGAGGGSGGGAPARGASAGARAPRGGASGGGARGGDINRNVTIILGAGWDGMTERERNTRLARSVQRGMGADHSTTMRDG